LHKIIYLRNMFKNYLTKNSFQIDELAVLVDWVFFVKR